MKHYKRVLALLLAVLMLGAMLAACSGGQAEAGGQNPDSQTPSGGNAAAPGDAQTPDEGPDEEEAVKALTEMLVKEIF